MIPKTKTVAGNMGKSKIIYREKYYKGNVVNSLEIKRMVDENIDDMTMEMRERTKYVDGTEGIVVELRY